MKTIDEQSLKNELKNILNNFNEANNHGFREASRKKLLIDSEVRIRRLVNILDTGSEPLNFKKKEEIEEEFNFKTDK